MTTPLQATSIITTQFNDNYDTTAVRWPNQSFDEPSDGSSWVSFDILFGDAVIVTVSQKHSDQLGHVFINVFTKTLSGTVASTTLIQEVRAIFNRLDLTGIHFGAPEVRPIATNSDDLWYQVLVRIPFTYNESVT